MKTEMRKRNLWERIKLAFRLSSAKCGNGIVRTTLLNVNA